MSPVWKTAKKYDDILYHKAAGMARITINRPEKRNAFRPQTVAEIREALLDAQEDQTIGVVFLTGAGPAKDGKYAFCARAATSRVRGHARLYRRRRRAAPQRARSSKTDPLDAERS
jgi:naphthoate synthase